MIDPSDLPSIPVTPHEWDAKFNEDSEAWLFGREPSEMAKLTLTYWKLIAGERKAKLIDFGCGQGRDAVYFARHGLEVTAVDGSKSAIERMHLLANEAGAELRETACVDVANYAIVPGFDVYYSHNCYQFLGDQCLRKIEQTMNATAPGGINAISIFSDEAERARGTDGVFCMPHNRLREIYAGWRLMYYAENILWREPSLAYLSFAIIIAVKQTI